MYKRQTYIDAQVRIGVDTVIYPGNILEGETVIGSGCTLLQNNRIADSRVGDGAQVQSSVLLDCAVGAHTQVGPFAYLRPKANVGQGCRVGDFVELKNANIGDGTKISHLTYVGDSDVGERVNLGCGVVFVNYDGPVSYTHLFCLYCRQRYGTCTILPTAKQLQLGIAHPGSSGYHLS